MSDQSHAEFEALAAGDALARQVLAELAPLVFREAADEPEREAAFRLRYRALTEMGLDAAAVFPDRRECDEFDASAVQIIGVDGGALVATCRLVLPSPGRPLPMLAAYALPMDTATDLVEWGRVVVDPTYRGDGHSVFMGLAARGWLSLRARGFSRAIAATPKRLISLFDAIGFAVTVLGEPRVYWGEQRYPILCEGPASIPGLQQYLDPVE
jgi:N-acyl-L-homoserine lactone synthetase